MVLVGCCGAKSACWMPFFCVFLTENGTGNPLFVLTENSLCAEVVDWHARTLGELLRPLSTSDDNERGCFMSFLSKNTLFSPIFDRILSRSATFCSDRELSCCRSCRASSSAPWVNFSGSQVLLMTLTPSVLWQL